MSRYAFGKLHKEQNIILSEIRDSIQADIAEESRLNKKHIFDFSYKGMVLKDNFAASIQLLKAIDDGRKKISKNKAPQGIHIRYC